MVKPQNCDSHIGADKAAIFEVIAEIRHVGHVGPVEDAVREARIADPEVWQAGVGKVGVVNGHAIDLRNALRFPQRRSSEIVRAFCS